MSLSVTSRTDTLPPGSIEREVAVQLNALLVALRAICVILDADGGVTATNLTATLDAGVTKVGTGGTAVT